MTGTHIFYVHTAHWLIRSDPWFYMSSGELSEKENVHIWSTSCSWFRDTAVICASQTSQPHSFTCWFEKAGWWSTAVAAGRCFTKQPGCRILRRTENPGPCHQLGICCIFGSLSMTSTSPYPCPHNGVCPSAHCSSCVCYSKCHTTTPLFDMSRVVTDAAKIVS